jgi:hypothetical protein
MTPGYRELNERRTLVNAQSRRLLSFTVCLFFVLSLTIFALPTPISAQSQGPGPALNHNVAPDVEAQFADMSVHGDPLAMRRGVGDDASTCRHYQSVNRVNGPDGTPYMLLTRSGTDTSRIWCSGTNDKHFPGELLIVRMGSRPTNGERMGTNRLQLDKDFIDTVPPENDIGVAHIHFNGRPDDNGFTWPPYSHPGGAQLFGDVLVVAMEDKCTTEYEDGHGECLDGGLKKVESGLLLLDVSNPEQPRYITSAFNLFPGEGQGLGVVGVAQIMPGELAWHPELAQGGFLFALTYGSSEEVRFAYARPSNPLDLKTAKFITMLPTTWHKGYLGDHDGDWHDWQTMNLVRDTSGAVYIVAAAKNGDIGTGDDVIGLFRLEMSRVFNHEFIRGAISFVQKHHVYLGNPDMGSLDAASSLYVSPSGQLIFYTGPHDNETAGDNIELGEFSNVYGHISKRCGPLLRPSQFPASVDEEQDLKVRRWLAGTYIEPWVSMFADNNFYADDDHLTMSYSDQYNPDGSPRDNWGELGKFGFDNDADSFTWCGPEGSKLTLYEDPNFAGDTIEIYGEGRLLTYENMSALFGSEWHDRVSSARIEWERPDLRYTLGEHSTTATIDPANGDFVWKPGEADGPFSTTFLFNLCEAKDGGMCDSQPVTITVNEVNKAPSLNPIAEQSLRWGEQLSLAIVATDEDRPANDMTYSLVNGPQGANIHSFNGSFTWKPTAAQIGTHTIRVKACDNGTPSLCAEQPFTVKVEQRLPSITLGGDGAGQYSDQVALSAVLSDAGAAIAGKEVVFSIGAQSAKATTDAQGMAIATFPLNQPEGDYQAQVVFAGDKDYHGASAGGMVAITPEDASVSFDPANTAAEQVAQPGGASGAFTLQASVQEASPDAPSGTALAGDIANAQLTMQLVPLGLGSPVTGTCTPAAPTGTGSGATLPVSCSFNAVPVNTYTVVVTVGGGFYAGSADSVVTIFDPSLGSTSGGGWLTWIDGEQVNVSFTAKYVNQDPNAQASFQLMRQTAEGGKFRLRSTSLQGLSMGEDGSVPLGWATFTGMASYQEPAWSAPRDGYRFTVYVEDRSMGADRFWVEVRDPQGALVQSVSLSRTPQANALDMQGGNIRVPHGGR